MNKNRTNRLYIRCGVLFFCLSRRPGSSFVGVLLCGLGALAAVPSSAIEIPEEPPIRPLIGKTYASDKDGDGIDDVLCARAKKAQTTLNQGVTAQALTLAREQLAETVEVELVFTQQITQDQIDAFQSLGGEITHVYQAVSYGWNGRIALDKITELSAAMALPPVLIHEARRAELHMDTATRTGRVRPVWTNFAGVATGFSGNTNITIAIVDTGVDESHADLAGRNA